MPNAYALDAETALANSNIMSRLKAGQSVDLIVEYDDTSIQQIANTMRKSKVRQVDDANITAFKVKELSSLKEDVDGSFNRADMQHLKTYEHLPMSFKRFTSESALKDFLANANVKAVYENERMHKVLAQSLPLINQPTVATAGLEGLGTTVAVIDDGIDYTNSAFGGCSAPNAPSTTCRVVYTQNFAATSSASNAHGTNVSAIVLGVAPLTKIAMLNVFDSTDLASVSDITNAINWAIANKATYNIVAINMSLGGDTKFTSVCNSDWSRTPVNNAKNAGITVVVASGNSAFTDGIASPACAANAISVGAVYDSNIGGINWGVCNDASTATDKVTCFSNSANFLTMLAPGSSIVAGGITQSGTSQASPHVAGAVAVLRSTYPSETLSQTKTRLTSSGVAILDSRNNITKPRLNLLEAARPANDAFANRITLSGTSGSSTGLSTVASKEGSEPNHAGNVGGSSVWFKWVATASGQVTLSTANSDFDTLLAVYTGNSVSALTQVTSNDNETQSTQTSQLVFQAVSGTEYQIAVDGVSLNSADADAGLVSLAWSLNTSAASNLSLSVSGPSDIIVGQSSDYILTLSNLGPQSATNAKVLLTVPSGATFVSATSGCSINSSVVTCVSPLIANGDNAIFTIRLVWNSPVGATSVSATASSDLADTVSGNNSASIQTSVVEPSIDNTTDAPSLPEWAAILLAASLLMVNSRQKNSKHH